MSDTLLKLYRLDDSNKWSKIGFGEEKTIIEVNIRHGFTGHKYRGSPTPKMLAWTP